MNNKIYRIIAVFLVFACLSPMINNVSLAADTTYLLDSTVTAINPNTGSNQIYLKDGILGSKINGGDIAALAKGNCSVDVGKSGYAVVGFSVTDTLFENCGASIQLEFMSQKEKTVITISDHMLSVGDARVYIGTGTHKVLILFDIEKNTISIGVDGKLAGTFNASCNITDVITHWRIYAFSAKTLSTATEIVLSDLYITSDKAVFDENVDSIVKLPSSVFRIFETYDDLPANFTMIYTGYSWTSAALTSVTATVVSDGENNQVLKLQSKPRTVQDETDVNSASLYSTLELASGKNVLENDILISSSTTTAAISLKNGKKTQTILSVKNGKVLAGESEVADISLGNWHTMSIIVDTAELTYDAMLDGIVIASGEITELSSAELLSANCNFYLDITAPNTGKDEVLLDNYKVYAYHEPVSNELLEAAKPAKFFVEREIGEKSLKLQNAVVFADGTPCTKVFGENDTIIVNGIEVSPYIAENGEFMLPCAYISEIYDKNITAESDVYTETVDSVLYISIADIAGILGKKYQIHENGLAILSDSKNFYNPNTESFEIDILCKLLKNSKHGVELFTENSDEFFDMVRERIASGEEPYKTAWQKTKATADRYVKSGAPALHLYGGVRYFFNTGLSTIEAVRDCAFVYRVTGEEKYAEVAKQALLKWVDAPNPFPVLKENTQGSIGYVNGLHLSRIGVGCLYGYSFLQPYLDEETCHMVELLAQRLASGIKISKKQWQDNNYFGQQYYQNHIDSFIMGITAAGIVAKDLDLLYYVLEDKNNERKFSDLITGAIIMGPDDDLCISDKSLQDSSFVPQKGEVYDRYRVNTNRGLQYVELASRLLFLTAEMLYQNDCDYFSYVGENGENLKLPFEFYGDYWINSTEALQTIQSGYYAGDYLQAKYHAIYPMVRARYPENEKIQYVCDNVYQLAQSDGEIVGWLSALTH